MRKYLAEQPRKGVAPWLIVTVIIAVLALVATIVPQTLSQARAEEEPSGFVTVAEEIGQPDSLEPASDEINVGSDVDTPEVEPADPTLVEEPTVEEVPTVADTPEVEEPSLVEQALRLFAPSLVATGNRDADVTIVVEVATGQYNINDNVAISGTWAYNGTGPDLQNGDSFRIQGPDLLRIVDESFVLKDLRGLAWGTCYPFPAENYYNCEITSKPSDTYGGEGKWDANATAIEAGERDGYSVVSTADISKTGRLVNGANEVDLHGALPGSVVRYSVMYDSSLLTSITEDIVIDDTFSDTLKLCTNDEVTNLTVSQPFGAPTASITPAGSNGFTLTITPPASGFSDEPIYLRYSLCASSGGRDASGTVYRNDVIERSTGVSAYDERSQVPSASGTANGVIGGSFNLNKVIDPTTIPVGFDPATTGFTVKVDEYAPNQYPGGTPEATYNLTVLANGEVVGGFNARPAGWKIVLSELAANLPEIPGHKWGTPVFTGEGIETGLDANGNSYAVVSPLDPALEQNVAVQLKNNVVPLTPAVKTQAWVGDIKNGTLSLTGGTVKDVVTYENLKPNTAYVLRGTVMDEAGEITGIAGTANFTTGVANAGPLVNGTAEVEFTISGSQAAGLAGKKLVVFEELAEAATPNNVVAEHKDLNDAEQTFWVERQPQIGTTALVSGSEDNVLALTGGEVIDTVDYTDLKPGTTYKLDGTIMYVNAAGEAVSTGITSSAEFTTPADDNADGYVSGTTTVTFTISAADATRFAGQDLVVFERLYLDTSLVAKHEDKDDEDQTFEVEPKPSIGTTAKVEGNAENILSIEGGKVTDTVAYTNLKANTEYRISGEIMHVAEDGTVTATGIKGETTFTPTGEGKYVSGLQDVVFTIPAAEAIKYLGEKLVVFEAVTTGTPGTPVAEHKDKDDVKQTFWVENPPEVIVEKKVTGPKGDDVTNDETAVFQITATWVDENGETQKRTYTVRPGEEVSLEGLPLNTEIALSETGAQTGVSNVKWGDVIWSGTGVVDEAGSSRDAVVTIEDPDAPIRITLENKTSSSGLIIIPIPIIPPTTGTPSPTPPTTPVAPPTSSAAPATPTVPATPAPKVKAVQPQAPAKKEGLAVTGANVAWIALGGILVLLLGAALVLRGRRKES